MVSEVENMFLKVSEFFTSMFLQCWKVEGELTKAWNSRRKRELYALRYKCISFGGGRKIYCC